jgi:hypothetical protein
VEKVDCLTVALLEMKNPGNLPPQWPVESSTGDGVPITVVNVTADSYATYKRDISEQEGRQRRVPFLMSESSSHDDDGGSEE